jgi:hypothetical protein
LELAKSDEGLAGVVAADGCRALVEALKIAEDDDDRVDFAKILSIFISSEDGCGVL